MQSIGRAGETRGRWLWLALVCIGIHVSAQSVPGGETPGPQLIPRSRAQRETQYAAHRRILLNVQATDASGHAVTGLDAHDFKLEINHEPQTIASFRAIQDGGATAHAHAFFLIDLLNNSSRDLAVARRAIEGLGGGGEQLPLPASLAVLTENGTEVGTTSRNAHAIAAELERITKNYHPRDCAEDWNNAALGKATAITSLNDVERSHEQGQTVGRIGDCLNEKYQLSLTALLAFAHHQRDVPGRAILIWIGPGWPVLSGKEFSPDTPDVRAKFFENLVQASTQLREGQVTLDAVSWPNRSPVAKQSPAELSALIRETPSAEGASARSVAMPVLAHGSGGQVYLHEKNLTEELAACLADANSYYVLGFDSAPAIAPDEFRAIDVEIDRPGVTVRTNTGYFAQP